MKAEEARTYKEQVLSDFISGQSAKAISKKYKMHERHVKMILDESGIDAFEEYKRRLADGTYAHLLSHQKKDPEAWYKARFGKTRKEFAEERERKQREQQEKVERSQAARCLISVLKATAKAKREQEKREAEEAIYAPRRVVCKQCGKEWTFYPSRERYGRRVPPTYCSRRCTRVANLSGKSAGHRLRMYGRGAEPRDVIKLKDLVLKEGGTCYICGEQIDWGDCTINDKGNFICGANYPTVEHIKPLSKGGTHTWNNVKLAHHLCNCKKASKESA